MTDNRGPKERAYDEHIAPLMTRIIAVCKEHKINAAAHFVLDFDVEHSTPMRCTTILPVDKTDAVGSETLARVEDVLYPRPDFMAMTIMSEPSE